MIKKRYISIVPVKRPTEIKYNFLRLAGHHLLIVFTVLLFFSTTGITASGQQNDSLLTVLDTARNRDVVLTTLDALGKKSLRTDTENAIYYYQEYQRVAGKEVTKKAYALNQIGNAWYYANDTKRSTENYFKALETLGTVEDPELLAKINNNIGWNLQKQGELEPAIEHFLKAELHASSINNKSFMAMIANNLGVAYKNTNKYSEALEMYNKAYALNQELNNIEGQIFNLNNISILNIELGNFDNAKQVLKTERPLIDQLKDTAAMINYLITNGELLMELNLPQAVLDSTHVGLNLVENVGLSSQRADLEFLQYQAYEALGQYEKALERYINYAELNDSIYRSGQTEFIQELSAKYNIAQKENDLQVALNKNLQQQLYLILISGGLALTLIALFLIWRNYTLKLRKNKELFELNNELKNSYFIIKEKNEEIQAQAEELKEANRQIQMINENLEDTVYERTQRLKLHNERLVKYARMNAHDVRGPLARILGLVQLLEVVKPDETSDYISRVKVSANELDAIIYQMNKILEEDDFKNME